MYVRFAQLHLKVTYNVRFAEVHLKVTYNVRFAQVHLKVICNLAKILQMNISETILIFQPLNNSNRNKSKYDGSK